MRSVGDGSPMPFAIITALSQGPSRFPIPPEGWSTWVSKKCAKGRAPLWLSCPSCRGLCGKSAKFDHVPYHVYFKRTPRADRTILWERTSRMQCEMVRWLHFAYTSHLFGVMLALVLW